MGGCNPKSRSGPPPLFPLHTLQLRASNTWCPHLSWGTLSFSLRLETNEARTEGIVFMLQLRESERHDLFHEVATIFPPMTEEEFALFVADIQLRGVLDPIWTSHGKIIDGIHRYRACQQLGIEPRYQEWDG